jgi:hypothetical protein
MSLNEIESELSTLECLEDAFLILLEEGQPFCKRDVIKLASEYKMNDPFCPVAEKTTLSPYVFAKSKNERLNDLSRRINLATEKWKSTILSQRQRGIRGPRPKPQPVPMSARAM